MKQVTIQLLALAFVAMLALPATAQPQVVTIRDINAISQDKVDQLNALGTGLTSNDVSATGNQLIYSELLGEEVQFTAVILSDPLNSGLANEASSGGIPGRVHVFVRDTAAVRLGNAGMGIQVVDGNWQTNGTADLTVGDIVRITGTVGAFGSTIQVPPTNLELLGRYDDSNFNLPATILDPVVISTADLHVSAGDGVVLPLWDSLASYNGQFVRVEGAKIIDRDASSTRPVWTISSDEGETFLSFYDTSIRYRNDRNGAAFYIDNGFNARTNNFVPPPIGARVNLQGFITYAGSDPFNRSAAAGQRAILNISPIDDSDLEITETPPILASVLGPTSVPDGTEPITLTISVAADPTRSIASVVCTYTSSVDSVEVPVDAVLSGETYTCEIPAQPDEAFITYRISATDDQDATTVSSLGQYRTLVDGINSISDVQLTFNEGVGSSPFTGMTTDVDITAIVVVDPVAFSSAANNGMGIAIQDDPALSAWSGILIDNRTEYISDLVLGDSIRITSATIEEEFGVTQLDNIVYEKLGTATPYDYKVVATTVVKDAAIAEAHEGMRLRFENVIIGPNPDAPSDFGEWSFATVGTEDFIRADDASEALGSTTNAALVEGSTHEYMQGIWWFSFSNYKLVPESADDLGAVTDVATEDETLPGAFALKQNFPNPFNPTTSIVFTVPASGEVTLQVFDLLGRSVATLLQGPLTAGDHTVAFDASTLPSGTYLYRLTAGREVTTRVMTLLK